MSGPILVAYASTRGSTREVAEAVAETLRVCGMTVDLRDMNSVLTLADYGAVVLGAPLYNGRWHENARRFLKQNSAKLAGKPVAVFALGPVTEGSEKEWQGAHHQLSQELSHFEEIKPVAVQMFGGRFDPASLGFPLKLFMGKMPSSDLRNWTSIHEWAASLPKVLQV